MRPRSEAVCLVCAVVAFLCMLVSGTFSGTVIDTKDRADQASDTATQIQRERAANILRSCREQNDHYDDTVNAIDRLTLERLTGKPVAAMSPASAVQAKLAKLLVALPRSERRQIEQSRKSTAVIIGTLAPKRNCGALVALQAPSAASPTASPNGK